MPTDASYSIADLARLTRLNVRTIRYWISQGLVPASGESGPGSHYGQGHLDRLQLIQRLQAQYLPNAEIRRRLGLLSDAEVATLVADPADQEPPKPETSALDYLRDVLGDGPTPAARVAEPPPMPAAASASEPVQIPVYQAAAPAPETQQPPDPLERSQWERLSLGPDIELHIRRPLSRIEQRRVERLITIARQVLKEDAP